MRIIYKTRGETWEYVWHTKTANKIRKNVKSKRFNSDELWDWRILRYDTVKTGMLVLSYRRDHRILLSGRKTTWHPTPGAHSTKVLTSMSFQHKWWWKSRNAWIEIPQRKCKHYMAGCKLPTFRKNLLSPLNRMNACLPRTALSESYVHLEHVHRHQ